MTVENLIRREILGITPYVPGKPIEEVQRELGLTEVIKLASNENPIGPSPRAIQAATAALAETHLYPDGNCYLLKAALAAELGVKPEEIIVGNGCDEVIKLVAEAFFRPGDEVIVADPTFGEYAYATQLMGARLVKVKGEGLGHDLAKMAAAVTPRTKAIFLCNPNNPTGTMNTRAEMEAFIARIPPEVLIIIDQAYYEYVADPDYPNGIEFKGDGRVLTLRTFSKIYGLAGFRVGYGVGDAELIAFLNRVREPFNVNRIGQAAAVAALADREHVARSLEVNRRGMAQIVRGLTALGLAYTPSVTNFILFATPYPAVRVFAEMMKKGVIVRPANIFGLPQHIRVTIGTEEQNERFLDVLAAVLAGLKESS
ncbi:MAG TPA: histidinol-phosphate transaminase [Firmicutes bacterium]|uniref:Histidinol-phosphate aminotransferase n=1 Tax=Capillibacterium thermochitinicola TaxID=2699427 RepID=A0A8J6I0T7_9FIRM|nr:histidinol-phosphate transaminase [Capillibacterium thermochitinicola]MBA2132232.1 histidinol-phosphate transaminase [Capillibacterium thermochitinicola]HHW12898.1 histidinol-phosphate transaminase [Bacillota bacterium]